SYERVGGHSGDVVAFETEPAVHHLELPGDRPQRGRLARPIGAHEGDHLARVHVERHVEQHLERAVARAEPVDGKERRGAHLRAPPEAAAARPRNDSTTLASAVTDAGVPSAISTPDSRQ